MTRSSSFYFSDKRIAFILIFFHKLNKKFKKKKTNKNENNNDNRMLKYDCLIFDE
jgi:hypothetical protein